MTPSTAELSDLIGFLRPAVEGMNLANPMSAYVRRSDVHPVLVKVARRKGFDANLVRVIGWKRDDNELPECSPWLLIAPAARTHTMIEINGMLVDWTARQFDARAATPTVWLDLEEAGWDRMEETYAPYGRLGAYHERRRRRRSSKPA